MVNRAREARRKLFTPKPVVYTAWGLLAAALVAHFVPALEAVALILYAVGLIALCLLALTAPKKGTIAVPRVFLPMLAAAFLIVGCQIGMRPDESPLVWRSILLALILLIPLMISEKQAAADIDRGRFAARVFVVVGTAGKQRQTQQQAEGFPREIRFHRLWIQGVRSTIRRGKHGSERVPPL